MNRAKIDWFLAEEPLNVKFLLEAERVGYAGKNERYPRSWKFLPADGGWKHLVKNVTLMEYTVTNAFPGFRKQSCLTSNNSLGVLCLDVPQS